MFLLLFCKYRLIERFLVLNEMVYDSGQFMRSGSYSLGRPMPSSHPTEIVAKVRFAVP